MILFEKLRAERFINKPDWTISRFFSCLLLTDTKPSGHVAGFGVEDEKRAVKIHGETRIDDGIYVLTLTQSPKFSHEYFRDDKGNLLLAKDRTTTELQLKYKFEHELITVTNVKGFDRILWHWGNTDDDTDGCYIVGSVIGVTKGQQGVLNSRKKYTEVYPVIWRNMQALKAAGKSLKVEYIEVAA